MILFFLFWTEIENRLNHRDSEQTRYDDEIDYKKNMTLTKNDIMIAIKFEDNFLNE